MQMRYPGTACFCSVGVKLEASKGIPVHITRVVAFSIKAQSFQGPAASLVVEAAENGPLSSRDVPSSS